MAERETTSEFEKVVLAKIDASERQSAPLLFNSDIVNLIIERGEKVGLNFLLNSQERLSIVEGSQFRTKVKHSDGKPFGVQIFNRQLPKGKRWINFNDYVGLPDEEKPFVFFDQKTNKYDKTLAVIAMMGEDKFVDYVSLCSMEATKRGYKGLFGDDRTKNGRGLQLIGAKILGWPFAAEDMESVRKMHENMNRQLFKAYLQRAKGNAGEVGRISGEFDRIGLSYTNKQLSRTAGYPAESLPDLVRHLFGYPNNFGK